MSGDIDDFRGLLAKVGNGETLSIGEAERAFDIMTSGDATPAQMGAFLMGLKVRGETAQELAGGARALRAKMQGVKAPAGAIDIVGTGGDHHGTYNVSSCSAFVVAEDAKRKLEQQLVQAQKMEALGQLAGGIAHDFNNLLTVIVGHTDMLLLDKSDGPWRHDLEQIHQASERAASMTRQLLAFSRQSVLEPKVINLNTVVAQMETLLRRSIGEHIELVVRAAADAYPVKADPDQLSRALLNMAINARDAMPDGGTLVIETRNIDLPAEVTSVGDNAGSTTHVLLSMSDTGCGMSAETKSRLFEPFYTTKGQGKGTGLGLAVVDGIVKQSGGRIDVFSVPGSGTTFHVYLPAAREDAATVASQPDARAPRGHETVLLVEDEPAVREMTQVALQRHGYTVLPAASGAEAIRIAKANQGVIDVVLTDVVMPGMSGPQLVEQLRADHPNLAALFMSGYTSDAVLRHGIETGEADFLQKPFSTSVLAAKLRRVLDR